MNDYEIWDEARREPVLRSRWIPIALSALACAMAAFSLVRQQTAIDAGRMAQVHAKRVEHEFALLSRDNRALNHRLSSTRRQLRKLDPNMAPLASRVLKSVFTVQTDDAIGSAWVAWVNDSGTYLITANHVVEGSSGSVTILRKGGSWGGEVVARDPKNDLALVRVDGHPQNAAPLWQHARRARPHTGDQLLLVGSPFGLGGTVTTGVVSRVGRQWVQTDAAANPGNSGGPAIDRNGHVVGVMLAIVRGGQNIGFAVRIERACIHLRRCG